MTATAAARPTPTAARQRSALELIRKPADLGEVTLRTAGFSSLNELTQTVADLMKLPRLELDGLELEPRLAMLIPKHIAERQYVVPVFASEEEVTVATSDPSRIELVDWLRRELRRPVVLVVASPPEIESAIRRLYAPQIQIASSDAPAEQVSVEALQEAVPVVDRMIAQAVEMKASDIHVEATEKHTVVRFRIDGMLRQIDSFPLSMHAAIVSRVKVMAELDISERQAPQDGRLKTKRGAAQVDLRISILPTYFGEKICCRILDNTRACLPMSALGFDPEQQKIFERLIRTPYGLLLVTGPTGSGKSTTLYSALNAVRSPDINIVTVEDPVEYQLPGINQVQVNAKRGLTFANALRSILRQDPNVVLVGEIRDHETGVIAAEAALTGHLVMASLHTNDAPSAITRLTEMGIEPYLVAPALVGVVAQRLIRKVCAACAKPYRPTSEEQRTLGLPALPEHVEFMRGEGCAQCQSTGYLGRTAIRELLEVDDSLKAAIGRGATADEIRTLAVARGFRTMRFAAMQKLFAGETTFNEVLRASRS